MRLSQWAGLDNLCVLQGRGGRLLLKPVVLQPGHRMMDGMINDAYTTNKEVDEDNEEEQGG